MSDLISTKAVIHDLKDMAVEDDFCLDWLFNEREGHDLRIEVNPRLQEERNLQGLQSADESAEMTSPKMRKSEASAQKHRLGEDLLQKDSANPEYSVSLEGFEEKKNTPLLSELKRNVLEKPSLGLVRVNNEEMEEFPFMDVKGESWESEVSDTVSVIEEVDLSGVQLDEFEEAAESGVPFAVKLEENLSTDEGDNSFDLELFYESEGSDLDFEEAENEEQSQTIEEDISHQQFWEAMTKEWKKRLQVMKSLRKMRKMIKFNHLQCKSLIETYLNVKVLMQHPEDYLIFSMGMPDEIRTLRCVLDTFVELTRVMKHGEMLVQDCTGEDWIAAALMRVTIEPKHRQWKAVTPICLHLRDFQWILHVVGVTIASILSVSEDRTPNVDNEDILRMFTLTGQMPNQAMVRHDRETFLKGLLEYLNASSSSELGMTTDYQSAQFMVWKLQGRSPANEAQLRSRNTMTYIRMLGKGSYGVVNRWKWLRIEVAVKEWTKDASRVHFEQEIKFADLQHPHIVPVLDYWLDRGQGMLTMELMGAFDGRETMWANLWDRIQKGPKLSIFQAINVMVQIAEAMKYLKECRVVHRDLKATNVLVSSCRCGDQNCLVAKLADFGESKHKPNSSSITTKNRGTRSWMAPEVWSNGGMHKYTMAADVYSFAVTCSEILTGKVPFEGIKKTELHDAVVNRQIRPELPDSESCPTFLSAYICKCWSTDPKSRPIFSDICEFLRYCKERLLRNELAFNVPSFNENEARVLLKHLGLQWCLQKDENGSLRLSDDVYRHVVMLAIQQRKWMELDNVKRIQVQLDFANYLGDWTGAEHQYNIAVKLLQNLAEAYDDPEVHWRLGYCFELGLGVAEDFEEAALHYRIATVLDDRYGRAYVELGRCYALGRGVPENVELASNFWLKALECLPVASTISSIREQIEILVRKDLDGPGHLIAPTECRERAASRLLDLTIAPTGSPGRILLKYAFDEDEVALRKLKESTSCEEPISIEGMEGILKGEQLSAETTREIRRKYYTTVLRRDAERSEKEKDFIVKILQCVQEEVPVAISKESNEKPRLTLDASSKDVPAPPPSTFWLFVISFSVWFMLNFFWPKGLPIVSSPRQPLSPSW
jgi:serine/threonine protein kinase